MPEFLWSYILAALTTSGLWMAHRHAYGWMLCLLSQFVWTAYALMTRQYGFLIGAAAHAFVYARNWKLERQEECHDL